MYLISKKHSDMVYRLASPAFMLDALGRAGFDSRYRKIFCFCRPAEQRKSTRPTQQLFALCQVICH